MDPNLYQKELLIVLNFGIKTIRTMGIQMVVGVAMIANWAYQLHNFATIMKPAARGWRPYWPVLLKGDSDYNKLRRGSLAG